MLEDFYEKKVENVESLAQLHYKIMRKYKVQRISTHWVVTIFGALSRRRYIPI